MSQYSEVSAESIIDMPRAEAWSRLRDLSRAHHYVPGLIDTRVVTERREGVGASRQVYRSPNRWLDETVEQWDDGRGFVIRLHRGAKGAPPPFREAWFHYRLDDTIDNRTRFTATLRYRIVGGALGRLLERLALRRVFRGVVRDIALAMKAYYETGESITPARLQALKQGSN